MVGDIFEWEKPLVELERRIAELQKFSADRQIDIGSEIETLQQRADRLRHEIYTNLTPWQRVLTARHRNRPTTLDYIRMMCDDFIEFHGDRAVRDDAAIVGGVALFAGRPVTILGPQKGSSTKENLKRNFGLPHPEGYRKALRLMKQAEKFRRPIISLIDVVGAYPGIEAEQRGQGVVIAQAIQEMSFLRTPIVCVVTGEGGSGGALAIAVGDRVLMMENAWYSTISPEMCAEIIWRDGTRAKEAAEIMRLTAPDLKALGIVDDVVPEPYGGAHRDPKKAAAAVKAAILAHLEPL
ncbi:MAG TPA: acetyl-CoA carboxylase carboxyltransferase subunit alpha, partial [Limnochordia bacterium]|nr:acetyl-CoA carboxylase carboxyltransferase subunit alpha [Limnochordia bacterium]